MIETGQEGRFRKFRFRFDNVSVFLKLVTERLSKLITKELYRTGGEVRPIKQKKKPALLKPQLEFWAMGSETGFNIPSGLSRIKFAEFNKKNKGKWFKCQFIEKDKPKSDEILGFIFGAMYPLYVLHKKNIKWEDNLYFVKECFKDDLISGQEIDDTHAMFMTEFCPVKVYNLRYQKEETQRGELKKMNHKEAIVYVAKLVDYFLDNIGFLPDNVVYKRIRDQALLVREQGFKEPTHEGKNDIEIKKNGNSK